MKIYSRFAQLVTAPLDGDSQNGTDTCVMPNEPPCACKDPDNYVFRDVIHPAKETHIFISAEVEAALADRGGRAGFNAISDSRNAGRWQGSLMQVPGCGSW